LAAKLVFAGQAFVPVQLSAPSQVPVEARHTVPELTTVSLGQAFALPVHFSATSQPPATAARQVTVLAAKVVSPGHKDVVPLQSSAPSQAPVEARHVTLAAL
jgi:D-aminopeptidase